MLCVLFVCGGGGGWGGGGGGVGWRDEDMVLDIILDEYLP